MSKFNNKYLYNVINIKLLFFSCISLFIVDFFSCISLFIVDFCDVTCTRVDDETKWPTATSQQLCGVQYIFIL